MLVCVREFGQSELSTRHAAPLSSANFERHFSLYTTDTSATLVDAADSRARKAFNLDVLVRSSTQLQAEIVDPLLQTVLTPDRASQAIVVVDGHTSHRWETLFGQVEGILAHTARAAANHAEVASLSFSAVTLEDNNSFTDILADGDPDETAGEPTIVEDTREEFTSVEDAHYVILDSESTWKSVLHRVASAFADFKHQIFSFIFSFPASTGRPNTTMQFVSFTVNEVTRGMKSSRHAVSSAAALLECRSPTLTFSATKLLYLLKPALLGQQPGAWVACFSPVSVQGAAQPETFQEAFAVAQTVARLYSSRIAVLNFSLRGARDTEPRTPRQRVSPPASTIHSTAEAPSPLMASDNPLVMDPHLESRREAADHAMETCAATSRPVKHLVDTPLAMGVCMGEDRPTKKETAFAAEAPLRASTLARSDFGAQTSPEVVVPSPLRETIPRDCCEEHRSPGTYESDTYRAVMERALSTLRAELRASTAELTEAKGETRRYRYRNRQLESELEAMRRSHSSMAAECANLHRDMHALEHRSSTTRGHATVDATSTALQGNRPYPHSDESEHLIRVLRDDVGLLESRVVELTELVAFHQSEIKAHVSKERSYRQRILDLEEALHEKEREIIAAEAAVKEAHWSANAPQPPLAPTASSASRTSSVVAQEEARGACEKAVNAEYELRDARAALERERARRRQLEHLMRQRELEESRGATSPSMDDSMQHLRRTYESQLRDLRAEMADFRSDLERQVMAAAVPRNLSETSSFAATPVARRRALADSTTRAAPPLSPAPEGAAASDAATSSATASAAPLSTAPPPRQSPSFEEFMKEAPQYDLHRAAFLHHHSRQTA